MRYPLVCPCLVLRPSCLAQQQDGGQSIAHSRRLAHKSDRKKLRGRPRALLPLLFSPTLVEKNYSESEQNCSPATETRQRNEAARKAGRHTAPVPQWLRRSGKARCACTVVHGGKESHGACSLHRAFPYAADDDGAKQSAPWCTVRKVLTVQTLMGHPALPIGAARGRHDLLGPPFVGAHIPARASFRHPRRALLGCRAGPGHHSPSYRAARS
jgi:hypothetical protein